MEYRYSKWSDKNGSMVKSKRKKIADLDKEINIDNYEMHKNTIDFLSKKQKISDEQNERVNEREQELEQKRLPGLIDFNTIHHEPSGKRALSNERISNRYMVIQKSINPFLSTSNYISDLEVQDALKIHICLIQHKINFY
jgi:hypothetical protein